MLGCLASMEQWAFPHVLSCTICDLWVISPIECTPVCHHTHAHIHKKGTYTTHFLDKLSWHFILKFPSSRHKNILSYADMHIWAPLGMTGNLFNSGKFVNYFLLKSGVQIFLIIIMHFSTPNGPHWYLLFSSLVLTYCIMVVIIFLCITTPHPFILGLDRVSEAPIHALFPRNKLLNKIELSSE